MIGMRESDQLDRQLAAYAGDYLKEEVGPE
jgi:hypothetical protein